MVYTVMKTDITVAALDITSFVTVKITTMNNNQCHAKESILRSHQLLSYSLNSLTFTEHVSSLLFPPQPDSHPLPNSFSPPTFCSHTYSSLHNITIKAHMFSALQMQCWHNKVRDKKTETLTNQGIPYVMYQCQVGTNNTNEAQTSTTLS